MSAYTDILPDRDDNHICPWWLAYFFDNPLRRLIHPPDKILGPYVAPGMTVLDFGCGFGHYSIGMARLTGPSGRVVAADVQQKMLDKTMARARKAELGETIHPLLCDGRGIGEAPALDFALLCNSLHETPDPGGLLAELFALLKPGARVLLMEPAAHLKNGQFETELALAEAAGFKVVGQPKVIREMCRLLEKQLAGAEA